MAERREEGDAGAEDVDHLVIQMGNNVDGGAAQVHMATHLPVAEMGQGAGLAAGSAEVSGSSTSDAASEVVVPGSPSEDRLVRRISQMLRELPSGVTHLRSTTGVPCICRVHPSIREQDSQAYDPMLVSIGPFHRGRRNLMPMEQAKLVYLRDLLNRSSFNKLDNYINSIRECARQARLQYAEEIALTDDEFVEMLVLDGCFIIEYFVKRALREPPEPISLTGHLLGFSDLRRDLLLLENQIPFYVLVKLFEHSEVAFNGLRREPLTFMEISLHFFRIRLPMAMEKQPDAGRVLHLLHLYHLCLEPSRAPEPLFFSCFRLLFFPLRIANDLTALLFYGLLYLLLVGRMPPCFLPGKKGSTAPRTINCATELVHAGIEFRKKYYPPYDNEMNCFLNVSFNFTEGKLEMPCLTVEETTGSMLQNLIALEQCRPDVGNHFTSYLTFVGNIIFSESDVAILRSRGIIVSKLGRDTDDKVAALFNVLSRRVTLDCRNHYNAGLFREVNRYCEFPSNRWRASLMKNGPLFTAGTIFFVLTVIQTYFAAFPRK